MKCSPREIIKSSFLKERLRYRDADTEDIVRVIMEMDTVADKYVDAEAAQCLRGGDDYETLGNVWQFVKGNLRYRPDARGKERVKSPAALFTMGVGDCKSFSIAEAALLRALGFKGIRYRFAAYGGKQDVTHVYVVVKYRGKDVVLDAVHSRFDEEVGYDWKRDIPAARATHISGIGSLPQSRPSFTTLFALWLIAWGILK